MVEHSQTETDIRAAQQALITLGYDLGPSGADGDWGPRSREAGQNWQDINGFENTDIITPRQMDTLQWQAQNPEIFKQLRVAEFMNNFDDTILGHLDPVRRNLFIQSAAHLGAEEDANPNDPTPGSGLNTGPAVEQYFTADNRLQTGSAWCAAFGSWVFDQIENSAGLSNNSFMQGNMRTAEIIEQIRADTPEAFRSAADYTPQAGDFLLIMDRANNSGHFAVVAGSVEYEEATGVITIDGNASDRVELREYTLAGTPGAENNHLLLPDEHDPSLLNLETDYEVFVVDISALPNYNALNNHFNAAANFIPTASADMNFQLDTQQLELLQNFMRDIAPHPTEPAPAQQEMNLTEPGYTDTFSPG